MYLLLPLIIVSVTALGSVVWALLGLPELLTITYGMAELCQSLLVRCAEYSSVLKVAFLWAGFAVMAAGLLWGLSRGTLNLIKARRAVKDLPASRRGGKVVLIKDSSGAAFTHGFLNPRIYISTGLLASLDSDEKKAVFLHELHHRRRLDPLRFFLLNLLKDTFFYLPAAGYLAGRMIARGEHEADKAASIGRPLSLASALVKAASFGSAVRMPASITGGGRVSERVTRLIEGSAFRFAPPSIKTVAVSVAAAALLSLSLALPLGASQKIAVECSTGHCAMHANRLGEECRTHCATAEHRRHQHRQHHQG
jgi:beta-lactamase regulating signal transducer with metallopeptidase domain